MSDNQNVQFAPLGSQPAAWLGTRLHHDGKVDSQSVRLHKMQLGDLGYLDSEITPLFSAPSEMGTPAEGVNYRMIAKFDDETRVIDGTTPPQHRRPPESEEEAAANFMADRDAAQQQADNSRIAKLERELAEVCKILKDGCDRSWEDETPRHIAAIASNAIYWRGQAAEKNRRDAERYKWIRAEAAVSVEDEDMSEAAKHAWSFLLEGGKDPVEMDAAIDRARTEGGKP